MGNAVSIFLYSGLVWGLFCCAVCVFYWNCRCVGSGVFCTGVRFGIIFSCVGQRGCHARGSLGRSTLCRPTKPEVRKTVRECMGKQVKKRCNRQDNQQQVRNTFEIYRCNISMGRERTADVVENQQQYHAHNAVQAYQNKAGNRWFPHWRFSAQVERKYQRFPMSGPKGMHKSVEESNPDNSPKGAGGIGICPFIESIAKLCP